MRYSHSRKVHKREKTVSLILNQSGEKKMKNRTRSHDQGLNTESSLGEQGLQWDPEVSGPWAELTHSYVSGLWCHELPPHLCCSWAADSWAGWKPIPDAQTVLQILSFFLRWYICLSRKDCGPSFPSSIDHIRSLQKQIGRCCSVLWDHPRTYWVCFLGDMWTLSQELSRLSQRQPWRHSCST